MSKLAHFKMNAAASPAVVAAPIVEVATGDVEPVQEDTVAAVEE